MGDAQHPDIARRVLLRRPVDHVLRRLGRSLPRRQWAQLPVGGHRLLLEPRWAGVHRHLHRSPLLCPGRGARPEPVRRPGHRRRLPGVEVERRQLGRAVPDLVGATRCRRDDVFRDTDGPAHRGPGRAALGDHGRRSPARVQQRNLRPPLLGGELRVRRLRTGPDHLLGTARTVHAAGEPLPDLLRERGRPGRGIALRRRHRPLVAGLCRLAELVHQLLVRRGATDVRGPDRSQQRPLGAVPPPVGSSGRVSADRGRRWHLQLRQPALLRLDWRHRPQPAGGGHG